jgi:hypothetical protein
MTFFFSLFSTPTHLSLALPFLFGIFKNTVYSKASCWTPNMEGQALFGGVLP